MLKKEKKIVKAQILMNHPFIPQYPQIMFTNNPLIIQLIKVFSKLSFMKMKKNQIWNQYFKTNWIH